MSYIYVASSWANPRQREVCDLLEAYEIPHYDFKDEEGFHWSEVMPNYQRQPRQPGEPENKCFDYDYLDALRTERAVQGFRRDFDAMQRADACVLVLPCGRSAHLELGWFVGQGKPTAILLDGPTVVPELMYKMVGYIAKGFPELVWWIEEYLDGQAPLPQ